jgi:hypothetical protein
MLSHTFRCRCGYEFCYHCGRKWCTCACHAVGIPHVDQEIINNALLTGALPPEFDNVPFEDLLYGNALPENVRQMVLPPGEQNAREIMHEYRRAMNAQIRLNELQFQEAHEQARRLEQQTLHAHVLEQERVARNEVAALLRARNENRRSRGPLAEFAAERGQQALANYQTPPQVHVHNENMNLRPAPPMEQPDFRAEVAARRSALQAFREDMTRAHQATEDARLADERRRYERHRVAAAAETPPWVQDEQLYEQMRALRYQIPPQFQQPLRAPAYPYGPEAQGQLRNITNNQGVFEAARTADGQYVVGTVNGVPISAMRHTQTQNVQHATALSSQNSQTTVPRTARIRAAPRAPAVSSQRTLRSHTMANREVHRETDQRRGQNPQSAGSGTGLFRPPRPEWEEAGRRARQQ